MSELAMLLLLAPGIVTIMSTIAQFGDRRISAGDDDETLGWFLALGFILSLAGIVAATCVCCFQQCRGTM